MIERPSPNYSARKPGTAVRFLVLHADASPSESATLSWITDPKSQVSYHLYVQRDGTVVRCVPDHRAAWAVGVSAWEGMANLNHWSVSLAFANRNNGTEPLTLRQIEQGRALVAQYRVKFPGIVPVTHTMVAMPRGRKHDPEGAPNFRLADFATPTE